MVLTIDEEKEVRKIIYDCISRNESEIISKLMYRNITNPCLDRKEIKIELGNFGSFLLGMLISLIGLGIWSWF
jgi:hypothetical protein